MYKNSGGFIFDNRFGIRRCSKERCLPQKRTVFNYKSTREEFALHYVYCGSGTLTIKGVSHVITKGCVFIVPPYEHTVYVADSKNPWEYVWIVAEGKGIHGLLAYMGLSAQTPFLRIEDAGMRESFNDMLFYCREYGCDNPGALGRFLIIANDIHKTTDSQVRLSSADKNVEEAKIYINNNFYNIFTISDIAESLCMDPRYLQNVFRNRVGKPIMKYASDVRLFHALRYMRTTEWNVKTIAASCGYKDSLYFSRVFRRAYGVSPTEYMKQVKGKN